MANIINIGSSSKNIKYIKIDDSIKNVKCIQLIPTRHPDQFDLKIQNGFLVVKRVDSDKGWAAHHKYVIREEIQDMNMINRDIKNEGLQVCVVSYGGCRSNALVNALAKNNIKCKTKSWHRILCHCPGYFKSEIPVIYIYDDPIKSLLSMKRRGTGFWGTNQQKLSNNYNVEFSDENLLKIMISQFKSWTSQKDQNVLIIKSCEIHEPHITTVLETHLSHRLTGFPIPYRESSQNYSDINNDLLIKYQRDIKIINNFK